MTEPNYPGKDMTDIASDLLDALCLYAPTLRVQPLAYKTIIHHLEMLRHDKD